MAAFDLGLARLGERRGCTVRVCMKDWGQSLATRARAIEIVNSVAGAPGHTNRVDLVFDFSDVAVVSGSFADEFVRRVSGLRTKRESIKLEDMSEHVRARMCWAVALKKSIPESTRGDRGSGTVLVA